MLFNIPHFPNPIFPSHVEMYNYENTCKIQNEKREAHEIDK